MRIKSLALRLGFSVVKFDFDPNRWTVVHSKNNNVGKTTLLRGILYGMGENIPSTSQLKFEGLETRLDLINDAGEYIRVVRPDVNRVQCLWWSGKVQNYTVPAEIAGLRQALYGVKNPLVQENLLGAWFVEQDHGWTMACEGTVIGKISFSAKKLVEGLCEVDFGDQRAELERLESELKRLETIKEVLQYRDSGGVLQDILLLEKPASAEDSQALEAERMGLVAQRASIGREIAEIDESLRDDKRFGEYIESMKLVVKASNGESVRVTRENLCFFEDNECYLKARRSLLEEERREINRKVRGIDALLGAEPSLLQAASAQVFSGSMSEKIGTEVDENQLDAAIKRFGLEKKHLKSDLEQTRMSVTSDKGNQLADLINGYASALGVSGAFAYCGLYPTKDKLSSISGAERMLLTLSYRLGYVKLLEDTLGICLPFVMDSVRAQELDGLRFEKINALLKKEFASHQVIVASRQLEGLEGEQVIEIGNGVMENASLCNDICAWTREGWRDAE